MMPDWKILVTDGLSDSGKEILNPHARVDDCTGISSQDLIGKIAEYEALIVRSRTKVTKSIFNRASCLRVVGRVGVGVDNIDLAEASSRGVAVVNAPVSTTQAVAEHTLALMLAMARHIPKADASMKKGHWLKKQLSGIELFNKTLGIIGMGRIGSTVARLCSAFGMKILAHDPYISSTSIKQVGAYPVSLKELYARSDIISLHIPITSQTQDLIDEDALGQMRPGVCLICTSRGGIIDEKVLLDALESGQVASAGLDVFSKEPTGASALVTHPNVITTPHIAAQTREAQQRASEDIALEVLAALRGEPLKWKVN